MVHDSCIGYLKLINRASLPILLSSGMSILVMIINVAIITKKYPAELPTLGQLMPLNFLILSIYEGTRAVLITLSPARLPSNKLIQVVWSLILISSLAFTLLGIILAATHLHFFSSSIIPYATKTRFIYYCLCILFTCCIQGFALILINILNCFGRFIEGLIFALVTMLINIVITHSLVEYTDFSIFVLPLGTLISSLLLIPCLSYRLKALKILSWEKIDKSLPSKRVMLKILKIFKNSGAPIFVSFLLLFLGVSLVNYTVIQINPDAVGGFSVAYRLQTFLMLPAIAIGIGMSFVYASNLTRNNFMPMAFLKVGTWYVFIIYLILCLIVSLFQHEIMHMLISDSSAALHAQNYLSQICFSYIILGPSIMFLTFVEQIGHGVYALIYNIFYLIMIIFADTLVSHYQITIFSFYNYLALINFSLLPVLISLFTSHALLSFIFKNNTPISSKVIVDEPK